jgi:hypothetical protein
MKVLVDPATARFRDRKNQSNENVSMDHTDRLKCITIRSNIHILLRNELQKSKLVAFDATQGDQFGYQVSLSGNYALIGSPHDNEFGQSSGSAYVFTRSATTGDWTLDVKLTATNSAPGDRFGESVSISGTRVLVGAPGKSSAFGGSGVAYLFERQQDGTWKETGKLTDFDGVYSEFAKAVSVSSEYAAAASIDSMYYSNAGHTVHVIANVTSATDIA